MCAVETCALHGSSPGNAYPDITSQRSRLLDPNARVFLSFLVTSETGKTKGGGGGGDGGGFVTRDQVGSKNCVCRFHQTKNLFCDLFLCYLCVKDVRQVLYGF